MRVCSESDPSVTRTAIGGPWWRDEGKGKIADLLTSGQKEVVRHEGDANAGRTAQAGSSRCALHLIPSGILCPDKACARGNGVEVDPEKLLREIVALRDRLRAVCMPCTAAPRRLAEALGTRPYGLCLSVLLDAPETRRSPREDRRTLAQSGISPTPFGPGIST